MEKKKKNFRYTVLHIGDILVDSMDSMLEGIKASFKGVSLTYEIHSLRSKRKQVVGEIGERVVEIRKADRTIGVSTDDEAIRLFSEFDRIQERLEASIMERESRVNPWSCATECPE